MTDSVVGVHDETPDGTPARPPAPRPWTRRAGWGLGGVCASYLLVLGVSLAGGSPLTPGALLLGFSDGHGKASRQQDTSSTDEGAAGLRDGKVTGAAPPATGTPGRHTARHTGSGPAPAAGVARPARLAGPVNSTGSGATSGSGGHAAPAPADPPARTPAPGDPDPAPSAPPSGTGDSGSGDGGSGPVTKVVDGVTYVLVDGVLKPVTGALNGLINRSSQGGEGQ
jgi:hypothetical protein